eukprot:jgi/Chlat1/8162/Chrsp76S07612
MAPPSPRFTDAEVVWLRRFAPVFVQCSIDIKCGYALARVFASFEEDPDAQGETMCKMVIVFEGEGNFQRTNPNRHNHFATFWYRTFNRYVWGRTADLNYLTIRGVNLHAAEGEVGWKSIRTNDHCGKQTFSQGAKGDCLWWFSLVYHYKVDLTHDVWDKWLPSPSTLTMRPVLYLNTANHLMGEKDLNPALPKTHVASYVIAAGTRDHAEQFARFRMRMKLNVYSMLPCLKPGRCLGERPGTCGTGTDYPDILSEDAGDVGGATRVDEVAINVPSTVDMSRDRTQ